MKIYVATSTRNIDQAAEVIHACRDAGHTVTEDWPALVREAGDAQDEQLSTARQIQIAQADMVGVASAQIIIALAHPANCGTLVEVGFGLALAKETWLVGDFERVPVFFHLPTMTMMDEDEMYRRIYSP